MEPEATLKSYAKLGFSSPETEEIVGLLNQLLANYHVHYQKLRNFHWNVEGSDFFELHEKFEELYNTSLENIDEIAERIRIFGSNPVSRLEDYLKMSEIREPEDVLVSSDMVSEIVSDFEILITHMMNVIDASNETGDAGTSDMMASIVKDLEKNHWMFSAWLKEEETFKPA